MLILRKMPQNRPNSEIMYIPSWQHCILRNTFQNGLSPKFAHGFVISQVPVQKVLTLGNNAISSIVKFESFMIAKLGDKF